MLAHMYTYICRYTYALVTSVFVDGLCWSLYGAAFPAVYSTKHEVVGIARACAECSGLGDLSASSTASPWPVTRRGSASNMIPSRGRCAALLSRPGEAWTQVSAGGP